MSTGEKVKKLSQGEQILIYLQSGHSLTTLDALNFFNCFRLASRISELRQEGHPIVKEMVKTPRTKKRVARYRLANVHTQTAIEMAPEVKPIEYSYVNNLSIPLNSTTEA